MTDFPTATIIPPVLSSFCDDSGRPLYDLFNFGCATDDERFAACAALAHHVCEECPDLVKRYEYTPYDVDNPMRDWPYGRRVVMVDRSFAEECMVGGAYYATLAALVRQAYARRWYVEDDVDICASCRNHNEDGSCDDWDGCCNRIYPRGDDNDAYWAMGIVTQRSVEIEIKCRELWEAEDYGSWDDYYPEPEDDDPAEDIADEIMQETALMEDGETYDSGRDSEREIANATRELLLRFVRKAIERGVISSADVLD